MVVKALGIWFATSLLATPLIGGWLHRPYTQRLAARLGFVPAKALARAEQEADAWRLCAQETLKLLDAYESSGPARA